MVYSPAIANPMEQGTTTIIRAALLDLGGVVYVGDQPIAGAVAAIGRLRAAGLAVRFLTNTTRTPRRALLGKLRAMGLPIGEEELFTPAIAARQLLEREGLIPELLIAPELAEDFAGLATDGEATALVVGDAGHAFTYAALNRGLRLLTHGARFLALANNRSFRDADGELSLDAGPFVTALAFASQAEPLVLGKPAEAFFEAALASAGCRAGEAVMVGDDVESDVAGALAAGLAGILVRTGKYHSGDEAQIDPPPSAVLDDLVAAADWILARA